MTGFYQGVIVSAFNQVLHREDGKKPPPPSKTTQTNQAKNNGKKLLRAGETAGKVAAYTDATREITEAISKTKAPSLLNRTLSIVGVVGDIAGTKADYLDYKNYQISKFDFTLNTAQRSVSLAVGTYFGPIAGIAADLTITSIRYTAPIAI